MTTDTDFYCLHFVHVQLIRNTTFVFIKYNNNSNGTGLESFSLREIES